jgi:hypothetical protein
MLLIGVGPPFLAACAKVAWRSQTTGIFFPPGSVPMWPCLLPPLWLPLVFAVYVVWQRHLSPATLLGFSFIEVYTICLCRLVMSL